MLASGAQTGGYEIFLQVGPEGSGPPPHNHPWDESFYVTSVPAKATISLSPMPNATSACGKVSSALSQGIYDTSNGFCRFTISFDNGSFRLMQRADEAIDIPNINTRIHVGRKRTACQKMDIRLAIANEKDPLTGFDTGMNF